MIFRDPWQLSSGELAAWYLFRRLNSPLGDFQNFKYLLRAVCRRERYLYRKIVKPKRSGGFRLILIPSSELKEVQKEINRNILASLPRHPNVFGFSGGSVKDALLPIVQANQPIFCADVRNAFPQTWEEDVFGFFRGNSFGYTSSCFLTALTTWNYVKKKGLSSVYRMDALPQGAPTSPRLFDLCFEPIDIKLAKFAAKIGGTYSRYADNIFVTAPTFWPKGVNYEAFDGAGKIPVFWHSPVISAVFQITRKKGKGYCLHKTYLCNQGQLLHALGLNLINGELHNTRQFKRRLRLTIYNLQKALAQKEPFEEEIWPLYLELNGLMQFAIKETLAPAILASWEELEALIGGIRYSNPSGTWRQNPQY